VPIDAEVKEFCQLIMDEEWLQLYIHETDFNERIWGKPVFDEDLFYERNPDIARPEDAMGRKLEDGESQPTSERYNQKAFNWTIYEFTESKIGIQLYFEDKSAITEGVMDKLEFMYQEPTEFLIRDEGAVKTPNAFSQTSNIPKQVLQAVIDLAEEAGTAMSLALTIGLFIAATAGKLSL